MNWSICLMNVSLPGRCEVPKFHRLFLFPVKWKTRCLFILNPFFYKFAKHIVTYSSTSRQGIYLFIYWQGISIGFCKHVWAQVHICHSSCVVVRWQPSTWFPTAALGELGTKLGSLALFISTWTCWATSLALDVFLYAHYNFIQCKLSCLII